MTRVFLSICLGSLAYSIRAATFTAASLSQVDVQAAIDKSAIGDTIVLPAGSATWTAAPHSGNGIGGLAGRTLQGFGIDVTKITDQCGALTGFAAIDATGDHVVLEGFTLTAAASGYSARLISISGRDVIVRYIKLVDIVVRGLCLDFKSSGPHTTGVMHHCELRALSYADSPSAGVFQLVTAFGTDSGAPPIQNTSAGTWGQAPPFGTAENFFIEDNVFWQDAQGDSTMETYYGGHVVVRHNIGTNFEIGIHGNDSGVRSGHIIECYDNTITVTIGNSWNGLVTTRGGSGVVFNNTITANASYKNALFLQSYRSAGRLPAAVPDYTLRFPYNMGQLDGSKRYDGNTPVTNGTGTHTGSNNATILTDATKAWAVNQHLRTGTVATNDNLQTLYIWNRTDGSGGRIMSNNATAVTATLSGGTRNCWNMGDMYVITCGYPGLDQCGWAGPTTFYGTYSTQTLIPWYAWSNSYNGATGTNALPFMLTYMDTNYTSIVQPASDVFIQANREYFNNTVKPGYTPYTYPHPIAGTYQAPSNTPVAANWYWCVGAPAAIGWDTTSSWSVVSTAATPHPAAVPGVSDTAVFHIDGTNTTGFTLGMNTNQSISRMIFRSTGGVIMKANTGATLPQILTSGAGGMTIIPGAGAVKDSAGDSLAVALSANQTWMNKSANIVWLQGTPVNGGSNSLTLVRGGVQIGSTSSSFLTATNAAWTNMPGITLAEGARLTIQNSAAQGFTNTIDRIADPTDIISYGGTLYYPYVTTNVFTEKVHALQLTKGAFTHQQDGNGTVGTNIFTYAAGLNHTGATATLVIQGGSYFGLTNLVNRMLLSPGQADAAMLGPWAIVQALAGGFAAYDTTQYLGYAHGVYGNAGASLTATTRDANGVYHPGAVLLTATTDLIVRALAYDYNNTSLLALAGHTLTITRGGLTFDSLNYAHTISNGTVTAGTGSDTNLYVFTAFSATNNIKVIDAVLANNGAGKVGLVKSGPYVLTLKQANTYTGNTTINDGTLYLSTAGSIAGSPIIELLYGNFTNQYYTGQPANGARLDVSDQVSAWTLGSAQTLMGNGVVIGNVKVSGTMAPGASTGMLTVTGNISFANNATLQVNVQNGSNAGDAWGAADTWNAGYGRLKVCGTVDLGTNARLDIELLPGASLNIGEKLFVIDSDGTDAVTGRFTTVAGAVLNEGDVFTTGGKSYKIYYAGDLASQATSNGNDVVVQVVVTPPGMMVLIL